MPPYERTPQYRSPRLRDVDGSTRPHRTTIDASQPSRMRNAERALGSSPGHEWSSALVRGDRRYTQDPMDEETGATGSDRARDRPRRRPVDDWMADAAPSAVRPPRKRSRPVHDWTAEASTAARRSAPQRRRAGAQESSPRDAREPIEGPTPVPADPSGASTALARVSANGSTGRRTITITGQGAERSLGAQAHDHLGRRRTRDPRGHHKPDRIAMWAVLLGIALMVGAATSSHAAVLTVHAHAVSMLRH